MTALIPRAEQGSVAAAAVGLVGKQRVGSGPCPARSQARDLQCCQQNRQHGAVVGVTGAGVDHQRPASAIDERIQLGRQTAAGPTDRVIDRFRRQILVIRPSPCVARQTHGDVPRQRRGVLMDSGGGAVRADVPAHLPGRISLRQQPQQDLVPHAA